MQYLLYIYRWIWARPAFKRFNDHFYKVSLRGLGILNSEGPMVTGEAWFLSELASTGEIKTIVDVGANTDVYGATELPSAQIIAFEPHPQTVKMLRVNLKKEHLTNVKVLEMALSDSTGSMKLWDFADTAEKKHTQPTATLSSLNREVIEGLHQQPALAFTVKVETLDRMAKTLHLETIDLLKIDTEGFEYKVLLGAKKLLQSRKIRIIQFEFNEMNAYTRTFMKDFIDLLPEYRFFRLLPTGLLPMGEYRPLTHEIFGFQNIVAIPKDDPLASRFATIQ